MQTPIEIAFRHIKPSDEIRAAITAQAQHLEKISSRITSCHVVVNGPETRHRKGDHFHIQIRVAMPRKDVVVDRRHGDAGEREYVRVAIREAFAAAIRQIEAAAHDMRGEVKAHIAESRWTSHRPRPSHRKSRVGFAPVARGGIGAESALASN